MLSLTSLSTGFAGAPAPSFTFSGGLGTPLSITFNETFSLEALFTSYEEHYGVSLQFANLHAGEDMLVSQMTPLVSVLKNDVVYLNNYDISMVLVNYEFDGYHVGDIFLTLGDGIVAGDVYTFTSGQTITSQDAWDVDPSTFSTEFQVALFGGNGVYASNVLDATSSVVPEPSTYALLAGVGMLGYAMMRRNRHKQTV